MKKLIENIIEDSIFVKDKILNDSKIISDIEICVNKIVYCFNNGGKVFFCGNGGSASDAQHLSAEFSGRFYLNRKALFSEALHVNTSYLTAVSNDYGFEFAYSRLVEGFCTSKDILIGLSTSGNSKNIINAFKMANKMNVLTIGFTGESGGELKFYSTINLNIPSINTPRIQESHILIGHIICELVEKEIFG